MAEKNSVIKSKFISHGTLGSTDLDATRKFYEAFLGLEVVRTSKISMMVRLGGEHVYAVVQKRHVDPMPRVNHNGIDVRTDAEVDEAYQACLEQQEKWGLTGITKRCSSMAPTAFISRTSTANAWEILSNPKGGYT